MQTSELLREVREQAGLSVRSLAAAAGVSSSTVHRIEQGAMQPTVEMLQRLLESAGVRLHLEVEDDSRVAAIALARAVSADIDNGDEGLVVRRASEFVARFRSVEDEVAKRMVVAEPRETGSSQWDAFLAALVEWLAVGRDIDVPAWVYDKSRYLFEGWWVTPMESMRAWEYAGSPASFQNHGVYIHRDSLVNM
jgi:transcriptional regulator with XRE-family HTH domain